MSRELAMETLPGMEWLPVVYCDNNVFIRKGNEKIYVYCNTEYKTPLKGKNTNGWLSCGTWSVVKGKYVQRNGLGCSTGVTADTLMEVVHRVMNDQDGLRGEYYDNWYISKGNC